MKVSQRSGKVLFTGPRICSLPYPKEQNTRVDLIAPAAFTAGAGLGLHPQPVPHPMLAGKWVSAQGRFSHMSSLRSLRTWTRHRPPPPGTRKGSAHHTAGHLSMVLQRLEELIWHQLCPVGPKPGCYHDPRLPAPVRQPLPSRGFLKLHGTGWEGPLHWGGRTERTWGVSRVKSCCPGSWRLQILERTCGGWEQYKALRDGLAHWTGPSPFTWPLALALGALCSSLGGNPVSLEAELGIG